jgi:hypothetical protein
MISEFYRPLYVRAFGQQSGHIEPRQDPATRRARWLAFAPGGSYLGAYSTRDRAAYALEQNTLRLLYRTAEYEPPEWPEEWRE